MKTKVFRRRKSKYFYKKKNFMCKNLKVFSSFSALFTEANKTLFFFIQGRYFNFFKNKELHMLFSRFEFNFSFYRNIEFSSYLSKIGNFFSFFKFPTLIAQTLCSSSMLTEKKINNFFLELDFKKMFVIGFFFKDYFSSIPTFFLLSKFFFKLDYLFSFCSSFFFSNVFKYLNFFYQTCSQFFFFIRYSINLKQKLIF